MRYWGTEDNVSRPGKAGKAARRPERRKRGTGKRADSSARRPADRKGAARRSVASGGSVNNYPFLRQFYRNPTQLSDRLLKPLFGIEDPLSHTKSLG